MKYIVKNKYIPNGKVNISGAKNSATRLMSAALLSDQTSTLYNFPTDLEDVKSKTSLIRKKGADIRLDHEKEIAIISGKGFGSIEPDDYHVSFRTSYLLAASELLRNGIARVPYPGGCKIGERKYDLHIMVWEAFGATVIEKNEYIEVRCKKLSPAKISFPISTVGGTENALLCASIVPQTTIIENAYVTPEIENLIQFLKEMGVQIELSGTSYIRVKGEESLSGATVYTIPDRIEALTWIVYAILSKGTVTINNVPFDLMKVPLLHLNYAGIDFYHNKDSVYISPECLTSGGIEPFELACGTYPGIISDMQPLFVLLGLGAQGRSKVFDYRYPKRNNYLNALNSFTDNALRWKDGEITINGPVDFKASTAKMTDLRGTMSSIIAALLAGDGSSVDGVEMALRGYSNFENKLNGLGVSIESY